MCVRVILMPTKLSLIIRSLEQTNVFCSISEMFRLQSSDVLQPSKQLMSHERDTTALGVHDLRPINRWIAVSKPVNYRNICVRFPLQFKTTHLHKPTILGLLPWASPYSVHIIRLYIVQFCMFSFIHICQQPNLRN